MAVADLELDLDVFAGPFDLLLTLILREEIDLLEVDLAEVVISYIDHLEGQLEDGPAGSASRAECRARGESARLDLEAATEFLVLIAALLEIKSRLLLPGHEEELIELEPGEAAEELLARLLDAHRYRGAAAHLEGRLASEAGYRFRSAPLPSWLRRAVLQDARAVYEPSRLGEAMGRLLTLPAPVDVRHMAQPRVSLSERLSLLRRLLREGSFNFERAISRADRVTVAVTVFAVLELYKQGELTWSQDEPFGEIVIEARRPGTGEAPAYRAGEAVA
jgi:segregation and condensation protein A